MYCDQNIQLKTLLVEAMLITLITAIDDVCENDCL